MTFKNKKLSKEEREEFKARKIVDFRRSYSGYTEYVDPMYITVDEYQEACLVSLGAEREEYYDVYFLFIIKDTQINIILHKELESPNTIIWSLEKVDSLGEYSQEQFLELLKEALNEFRWDGDPDERINGSADVYFDFMGGETK